MSSLLGAARTLLASAAMTAGLALASLAGCGGATTQDVLEANETASSSGTSGGTSGTSGGTSGTSGVPDASVDSSPACPQESEPNDGKDSANVLAPTRCGVISPNSESDFLTFQLKASSTSLKIDFTGKVVLRVEVNGTSVTLGGGAGGTIPVVKGRPYFIEIKAIDRANSIPWRVDLIEK